MCLFRNRGAAPDPAREPFEKGSLDPPKLFMSPSAKVSIQ